MNTNGWLISSVTGNIDIIIDWKFIVTPFSFSLHVDTRTLLYFSVALSGAQVAACMIKSHSLWYSIICHDLVS